MGGCSDKAYLEIVRCRAFWKVFFLEDRMKKWKKEEKMKYERRIKEKGASWDEVQEIDVKRALQGHWKSWAICKKTLKEGQTLWNPFAEYRVKESL